MNYLRGRPQECFSNADLRFNEDASYNFWYIFVLILISYLIYIFSEKKNIKII